jgi:hypothetical protein
MSYLLKALEKAERERKQNSASPEMVQSTMVVSTGLPKSVVLVLGVAVLLMLWKIIPQEDVIQQQDVVAIKKPAASTLVEPENDVLSTESEVIRSHEIIRPNVVGASPESQAVVESDEGEFPENEIKQLEELSKEMLQYIPSLQLESHIYSTAVDYRSVVINGRSFKQGQFVSTDVVLEQITEDGIVINVGSQRIALPKGISWVASNAQ